MRSASIGLWVLVLTVCVPLVAAYGGDTYWLGDPASAGDWSESTNWTNGVPVYQFGDYVYVDNGGTSEINGVARASWVKVGGVDSSTIVQGIGSDVEMAYVLAGYDAGTTGVYELNDGELRHKSGTAQGFVVGYDGVGTFRQTGGNLVRRGMSVGTGAAGQGLFELTGGTVSLGGTRVEVGANGVFRQTGGSFQHTGTGSYHHFLVGGGGQWRLGGTGLFTARYMLYNNPVLGSVVQSGGTGNIDRMILGDDDDESGSYLLSGGELTTSFVVLGYDDGTGVFRQTGGVHNGELILVASGNYSSNTTGAYELVGGALVVESLDVGGRGQGVFKQTGGTNSVGNLSVYDSGRYEYAAGKLELTGRLDLSGTLDLMGSDVTLYARDGAWLDLTDGTIANAGAGALDCSENSVTLINPGTDLGAIFAAVDNRGVIHTLGSTLVIPAGSTIATSGEITDHVQCAGTLVHTPGQGLSLSAGLGVTGAGVVDLGSGELAVYDTVSGMTGGDMSAGEVQLWAGSKFTQSGGNATTPRVQLYGDWNDAAVYEISGGELSTDYVALGGSLWGQSKAGRFVQTGGSVVVDDGLAVATMSSSKGTYELVDGQLSADVVAVGADAGGGPGLFRHEGGSSTTRRVELGKHAVYELAGGRLEVAEDIEIRGRMSQSGGTAVVGGELLVTRYGEQAGSYELSAGDLTAQTESVGDGVSGGFVQTGGTNTTDTLTIAVNTRYELSGGVLQINDQLTLNGQLDFADGDAQLMLADGGTASFVLGDLLHAAGASMIAGADTNVFFPVGFNPYTDFDHYACDGQTHLAGGMLDVLAGQTVYLAGDIRNRLKCAGTVLPVPETTGANLLAGAEVLPGASVDIDAGTLAVSDAASFISGGTLTGGKLQVGYADGDGSFTHSNGVVFTDRLEIGYSTGQAGQYLFDGGTINAEHVCIGHDGTGVFRQTGGTLNAGAQVSLDTMADGVSTYEMSGGALNGDVLMSGRGKGRFLHSGGHVQGDVKVYSFLEYGGREASYEMSRTAILDADTVRVSGYSTNGPSGMIHSVGRFSQSSPDNIVNVANELTVSRGGTYELSDGVLTADVEIIRNEGVFRQSGGRNAANRIDVDAGGRYEYTGGELAFGGMLVEGVFDLNDQSTTLSLNNGLADISQGRFEGADNATLALGAQVLLVVSPGFDPDVAFGAFSNQGTLYTLGSRLVVPQGRGFTASTDINDFAECYGVIQPAPGGNLNLNGGFALHDGVVKLGGGQAYTGQGQDSVITGGQLLGGTLRVNSARQSGGLVTSQMNVRGPFVLDGGRIDTPEIDVWDFFTQNDGEVNALDIVIGTHHVRPVRAYTMAGGQLTAHLFMVGDYEGDPGGLYLSGGRTDITGRLLVGGPSHCSIAGRGQVELEGVAVLSAAEVQLGSNSRGDFIQTGGVHNAGMLRVGPVDEGHYELQAGVLNVDDMVIGNPNLSASDMLHTGGSAGVSGDLTLSRGGAYDQRGGDLIVQGACDIGGSQGSVFAETTSWLFLSGGRSVFGSLMVGQYDGAGKGRLSVLSADAQVEVTDTLAIGPRGELRTVPGAAIRMTGSAFTNESTDPAATAGLGDLELIFEGGADVVDPFEVAGEDLGPVLAGFYENFALGALTLGGVDVGKVRLHDIFDNQEDGLLVKEALYVTSLNIGAGSYLDLNGVNLYYLNLTDSGGTIDLNGGSMTQVPEPGTLMLIALGFPMLLKRFRR